MKSLWKLSAVAVVAAGASVAQADVTPGTTAATGSELVLFVRDISEGASPDRVYARTLGITVDALLTTAGAGGAYSGPGQAINYSLPTFGPDSNLSTFLTGGTNFVWTIMGGDTTGTAAFSHRYVTTTQFDASDPTNTLPVNSALRTVWSQVDGLFNTLNGSLPDTPGSSTSTNGQWGQTGGSFENASNWFVGGIGNENALGQAANFYVLTNSSTQNLGTARVFAALDVVLTSLGELKVSAVPLPPALLLLGSAFAGLAGIGRRKIVPQTAKA
jgi:hypothetical protein